LFQDYPTDAAHILNKIEGNITTDEEILTFQRVSIPNLAHWTLIIQQPIHKILHSIWSFRLTFGMILLGAVFISLIIAFFINRRITKPIEHLTSVIEQVRAGHRDVRADIQGVDELTTLEKGFNGMLESIKASEEALVRTKQEAEAANLAKSRFLANMSHELRTPLNAIIGYGEMLQEEIADLGEAELSGDIEKIHLAGKHLLSTINDILDISKIEAGRMELYTESFYLPNMVNDIVQTLQPLFTKNQDVLKIHYDDHLGEMHADLTKTRQILLKMLSNASKFNEKAGTIDLEVLRETDADGKDWIVFRVTDSGIGMDAKQKEKLFQVFTQADTSATRKYGGTGLGLAITHYFVQIMGGTIKVDSQLGQGSTFTVRLPAKVALLVQKRAQAYSSNEVAVLEEGGLVLVIDDEVEVRKVLENYLTKQGYHVKLADSGEEGLRLARKVMPDVIILDVMMPKMDGWEVLSYLKADPELANIPVIILSLIEDKSVGYSLGASDYLIKPVTREQLSKVLQKYHFSQTDSSRLIMIIDDDPVNRDMVGRLFRKIGLRICKFENAGIALNYIEKIQPDLILLDLQMPEMDGFEFVGKLQEISDTIPVIIFSAKDLTIEDRERLAYVAKIFQKGSYRNDELLVEVKNLLSLT
jgi:signal transduction histidine kinase/CheY-like chemotaxis protein